MKYSLNIFKILLLTIATLTSCNKGSNNEPIDPTLGASLATITTNTVSNITNSDAICGGAISNDGGGTITSRGVCWSTSTGPTVVLSTKSIDSSGIGSFTSTITGLTASTLYYVRAYATNSAGTAYGTEYSFTTSVVTLPTLTTTAVTPTPTNAFTGGNISSDGGTVVVKRGVCWSTSPGPTVALATKTDNGTGSGVFNSTVTGLNQSTVYYLRAYATNSAGTAYGNEQTFTTLLGPGASFGGGIVAYILAPGDPGYDPSVQHGLIAAPSDQSAGIVWYDFWYEYTGATGTAIGTGLANTNAIIASHGSGTYAASICRNLTLGGYNDWFLPSKDELDKLYINRTAIGGFASAYYWSSSQSGLNSAWAEDLRVGWQYLSDQQYTQHVRAIRAF